MAMHSSLPALILLTKRELLNPSLSFHRGLPLVHVAAPQRVVTVAHDADDDVTISGAQGILGEPSRPVSRASFKRHQPSSSWASVRSVSSRKSEDDTPSRASSTGAFETIGVEVLEWRNPDGSYEPISKLLDDRSLEILTAWWEMYQIKETFHKSWVKFDPDRAAKNCCASRGYNKKESNFPNAGYQCELCSQRNRPCIVIQYDGQESHLERTSHTVVLPQFGKAAGAPFAYWQSKVV